MYYGLIFTVPYALGASMWVSKTRNLLLPKASYLKLMLWKGKRWNSNIISNISIECPHNCSQEDVIITKDNQEKLVEESARFFIVAHRLHYKQGLKHHVHPRFHPGVTRQSNLRVHLKVSLGFAWGFFVFNETGQILPSETPSNHKVVGGYFWLD